LKIPFLSDYIDEKKRSNEIARERIQLQKDMNEARKEAFKSIMSLTTVEKSLSDELYGGNVGQQYKIGSWALPIEQMRRKSRIAYWDSSFARSIIDRWVQIVVGKGLALESQPAWGMIKGFESQESRQQIIDTIETRFNVWAKSKKVHYMQEFNLDKLVNLAFFYWLYDGEFFAIFRYTNTGRGRNPLTIELIAPENIKATSSQKDKGNGNTISDGIEYDQRGVAVAYHVLNSKTGDSVRIPKFGARSGRQIVYHNYNKKNERQRRGVPLLSGEISEITQLADAQQLEVIATRINAMFAAWVEPPEDSDGRETISGGARKKTTKALDTETGDIYDSKVEKISMDHGGIIIDQLPAGHKIHSFDTKRPNVNFAEFANSVKRNIAAGAGIALSLVDYNYSQQYSSARGENIIQWYKVKEFQNHVPADFLSVIYKMWMWGEVDGGKFSLPGFNDEEIRDAWCNANWRGHTLPDIDPKKSMDAHKMEIEEGIKHRQRVASERDGGNVSDNIDRLKKENDSLAEARRLIMEVEKTTYSNSKAETISESTSKTVD